MLVRPRKRSPPPTGATSQMSPPTTERQRLNRENASLLLHENLGRRRTRSGVAMDTISELEKVGSWHTPQKLSLGSSKSDSRVRAYG
jgi:hypothetical protein